MLWSVVAPDLLEADLVELETDTDFAHQMVCEALFALGGSRVEDARLDPAPSTPRLPNAPWRGSTAW